jgi:hypothetical protein
MSKPVLTKMKREFLLRAKDAGVRITDHRVSKGSHSYFTIEYRGYWTKFTIPSAAGSWTAERNQIADLRRFMNKVDALLEGRPADLGLGTPGAIFRCTDDT